MKRAIGTFVGVACIAVLVFGIVATFICCGFAVADACGYLPPVPANNGEPYDM